jgi:hypothetical protein
VVSKAIGLSNGISGAVSGGALPADAASQLTQLLVNDASRGGIAILLLILVCAILVVIIAATNVIRVMGLVLLVAMAPLALSGYALPHTSWAPRWWWRALAVVLAIPPAQALTLSAAMHVFFTPGWPTLTAAPGTSADTVLASHVTAGSAPAHLLASSDPYTGLLTAVCLLYVMARIPFWLSRSALYPFGRSPVRSLLRFAFGAAVLSRFGRALRPARRGATARSGMRLRRPGGGASRTRGSTRGTAGSGTRGTGTGRPAARAGTRASTAASSTPRAGGNRDGANSPAAEGPAPAGTPPRQPAARATGRRTAPPLPDGSRPYRARHAAVPPLPAGGFPSRSAPRLPGSSATPRPVPPLPAGSSRGGVVPPLPAGSARRPIPPLPGDPGSPRPVPPLPAGPTRRQPAPALPWSLPSATGARALPAAGVRPVVPAARVGSAPEPAPERPGLPMPSRPTRGSRHGQGRPSHVPRDASRQASGGRAPSAPAEPAGTGVPPAATPGPLPSGWRHVPARPDPPSAPLPATAVPASESSAALPAAEVSPAGRHRRPPPLPAASVGSAGRHEQPPPLPAGWSRPASGDQPLPGDETAGPDPVSASPSSRQAPPPPSRGSGRRPRRDPRP